MMAFLKKITITVSFVVLILLISSFFKPFFGILSEGMDDLDYAEEYISEREWILAESLLERFLRTEDNPDKRWKAWMLLLKTSEFIDIHPATMHVHLSDMLQEFFDDTERKKFVLFTFAQLLQKNGDYAVASDIWNMYLDLDNIGPNEAFAAYRSLGNIYFRTRQYSLLEDSLYSCMALDIEAQEMSLCMYDLAYMKGSREEWDDAKDLLDQILLMETDDYTRARVSFMIGDILELQGKPEKSLEFFEMARLSHPNTLVVDNRIESLRKKLQ